MYVYTSRLLCCTGKGGYVISMRVVIYVGYLVPHMMKLSGWFSTGKLALSLCFL